MDRPWYAFYDKEVPRKIDYPKTTLKEMFNRNAENNPDKPYLILNDVTLPYRVCNFMARRLANGLLDLGVAKGDRVALVMPNIPQYPISLMACYKIGAIAVPANPLSTVPEFTHQFRDSGAETVIVMAPFADKAIQILKEGSTQVRRIVVVQIRGRKVELEKVPGVEDFDVLAGRSGCGEPDITLTPEDIAVLQYTGGTTGVSKGCILTHANLVAMLEQTAIWGRGGWTFGDNCRTLATVPLYHVFGMNCNINLTLQCAGTMVLVPQPTPDNILQAINRHEPNIWAAVPAMIHGLLNHPGVVDSKIGCLQLVQCGGSPLPVEIMKRFEELSGVRIIEGYGLSETSNVVTANPFRNKPGTVGIPLPDVDIRIVDLETGTREMATGEPGEIIAKGPQVMAGYWNNPEETANALKDGWLYTGDIGMIDEEGYLSILDRKKDMIICSGFNVYPREIDEVLYTNQKVYEACTIGVPDEKRGETVKAYIVLKPGETMACNELTDFCQERLVPYKVPKIVEFIDQLPRTPFGKPDRRALRAIDEAKRKQL